MSTIRPKILGQKNDAQKDRWELLPIPATRMVVKVLTFGAKKYSPGGWMHVPDGKNRYLGAAFRHLAAWMDGEVEDLESGLPHLAHAACNVLFILGLELCEKRASK